MDTIYAIWVSAIATGVIAIFTGINLWLILTIKSRDNEFRQQISDLYKAIILTNLIEVTDSLSDSRLKTAIELFNREYNKMAKTTIFKKEANHGKDKKKR